VTRKFLTVLAVLVGLTVVGYGVHAWNFSATHVWTDDAYVEGTVSPVSAKVPGHVVELRVDDNQPVRKGDLLLRIDPKDYLAKRDQARAAVAMAEASVRAARSEVPLTRETTLAQIDQARAAVEVALVAVQSSESAVQEARARLEAKRAAAEATRADLAGARSAHRKAGRELERMRRLVKDGYISQREFDQAEEAFEITAAAMEATQRRLAQLLSTIQQHYLMALA